METRKVVGVSLPRIDKKYMTDFDLQSKLVKETKHFIPGNIVLENPVEKLLMEAQFKTISDILDKRAVLRKSVFAIERFISIHDWSAIRCFEQYKGIYTPVEWGLAGTAAISVVGNSCNLIYWSVYRNDIDIDIPDNDVA